jgi:hypothetical protein
VKRPWLRFLVPRDWSGEQALMAASLLREAQDAVWDVHGEAMAESLGSWPRERWAEVLPEIEDDEIPF